MKPSQLLILAISVFSIAISSGCTSSQTEGDQSNAEVTDESLEIAEAIDNNDDLSLDFDGGGADPFADLGSEGDPFAAESEFALTEEAPSQPLEETPTVGSDDFSESTFAESTPTEAPLDDLAPDFGAPTEDPLLADSTDTAEPDFGAPYESAEPDFAADSSLETTSEPTPEPTLSEPDMYTSSEIEVESEPATTTPVPLKKVISVPYMHAGKAVNGIYIARDGDTLQSISQKIFGGDRVDELCSINAYNCSRTIRVGDKYYYNSPQRPNDMETVKTFYEDAGIPAQTYITQEGDNIRDLGTTLIGHPRSWMELWSLNHDVESKDVLPAGIALRYWKSTPVSIPTLAQNEPEPSVMESEVAMEPPVVESEPELPAAPVETAPPAQDMALNDIPEVPEGPSDMDMMDDFSNPQMDDAGSAAVGSMAEMEPPPPPPPPPPMETAPPMEMAGDTSMDDPNQTMALGVGAILLLAGVALFIAIRKRRARRPVDFNTTTQTQIE